jgi:hypothetical protein
LPELFGFAVVAEGPHQEADWLGPEVIAQRLSSVRQAVASGYRRFGPGGVGDMGPQLSRVASGAPLAELAGGGLARSVSIGADGQRRSPQHWHETLKLCVDERPVVPQWAGQFVAADSE